MSRLPGHRSAVAIIPSLLRHHRPERVTDAGIAQLGSLRDLEILDLSQCQLVTGDCLDALVKLPKLKKLFLPSSITTDLITKLYSFDQLETLMLTGDYPLESLEPLGELKSIKAITLLDANFSSNQLNAIRHRYPEVLWVVHHPSVGDPHP